MSSNEPVQKIDSIANPEQTNPETNAKTSKRNYFIVVLLLFVNLLNYIDRYTIAGVLIEIQKYYDIDNASGGLLQTVFICSYTVVVPVFGYLGDRYNRKYLIIASIIFWSSATLGGSFVPYNLFWVFVITRGLVGVGEALCPCVAPTIIGDLFIGKMRTLMLAVFYIAAPVGSGLGYILGSNIADAFDDWRYALRFTPPLCLISVVLLIIFLREPKRGMAEGSSESTNTTFYSDVKYLIKHKSFIWVTLGFTFAAFVMGGLAWWIPTFVEYSIYSKNEKPNQISLIFGIVTVVSGLLGVALSIVLAPRLRKKTKNADAFICGVGSLIAVPCLFVTLLFLRVINLIILWFIMAIAVIALCLCWTLVADILIYTIHPTRRSIASALHIFTTHVLGDAISPYIIGAIADGLLKGLPDTYFNRFFSLQIALYVTPFFAVLSFGAYLALAIYVSDDEAEIEKYLKTQKDHSANISQKEEENEAIIQNVIESSIKSMNENISIVSTRF